MVPRTSLVTFMYPLATFVRFAALSLTLVIASCATQDPSPPPRLEFAGTLDLSKSGVGFALSHPSGLTCSGQFPGSRLPEKFTVPLSCSDNATSGTMEATKGAEGIYGTVALADGRTGVASFTLPSAMRGRPAKRKNAPQN